MRSFLPLLLLLPSLAAAQTPTLTLGFGTNQTTTNSGKTLTLGQGDCDTPVTVTWSVNSSVTACKPLRIWAVDFETPCSATAPASAFFEIEQLTAEEVNAAEPLAGTTGSVHGGRPVFDLDAVFGAVPRRGGSVTACGRPEPETRRFRICGILSFNNATTLTCDVNVESTPSDLQLIYDHEPPAAPTLTVRPFESRLRITVPTNAEIASVRFEYRPETTQVYTQFTGGDPLEQFEITGLQNGLRYFVRGYQTDLAGNESAPSAEFEGTPVEIRDFWEVYKDAGGADNGGCGAAGGAGLSMGAALAVVALWLASRRRA